MTEREFWRARTDHQERNPSRSLLLGAAVADVAVTARGRGIAETAQPGPEQHADAQRDAESTARP
jgi:hypothetical protein